MHKIILLKMMLHLINLTVIIFHRTASILVQPGRRTRKRVLSAMSSQGTPLGSVLVPSSTKFAKDAN